MNIHQRRRAARIAALEAEQKAKEAAEKTVESSKLTKAALNKMGKDELEQLARDSFSIELDKRKTKASLVKAILEAQG
jgi:tRNA1(Val) A37 N6-methylase TrmN6